jgi:F-box/WD-40 domain protein MET30
MDKPVYSILIYNAYIAVTYDNGLLLMNFDNSNGCGKDVIKRFENHNAVVTCLCLVDKLLASGSWDKVIKIWQIEKGECLNTLVGHDDGISSLINLNNLLISSSWDNTIRVWNPRTAHLVNSFEIGKGAVYCLCSYSNHEILSGSWDETINLVNIYTGIPSYKIKNISKISNMMKISPNSIALVRGSEIHIYSIYRYKLIFTLNCPSNIFAIFLLK